MEEPFERHSQYVKDTSQPRIISEDPLVIEIDFFWTRKTVSLTVEDGQVVFRFPETLLQVISMFMNKEVDYIYGGALLEAMKRMVTVAYERERINHQPILIFT